MTLTRSINSRNLLLVCAAILALSGCGPSTQSLDNSLYLVGNIVFPGASMGVYVADNYAYVTNDTFGLRIVNISNPGYPELAATARTSSFARGICVANRYAYVAASDSGLEIFDINYPSDPVFLGACRANSMSYDVTISDRYAYLADGSFGLRTIDISNPSNPRSISLYATSGSAYDLELSGEYLYVVYAVSNQNPHDGLQVISIANPLSPVSVCDYGIDGLAGGVAVVGDKVFIGGQDLLILDALNPAHLFLLGVYEDLGAQDVDVVGGNVYAAIGYSEGGGSYGGLAVFEFGDPARPTVVSDYRVSGQSYYDIFVSGGYIYMTGNETGLSIFEYIR
jgi:hypothetical protein